MPHGGGRIDARLDQPARQRDRLGPRLGKGAPQRTNSSGLVWAVEPVPVLDERLAERDAQPPLPPALDPHQVGDRVPVAGRVAGARQTGVHGDARGLELGSELLERTLERCDAEGVPAWLETTEEATAGLYEHFGFHTVAAINGGTVLPGLWVMRRGPNQRSGEGV